MLFFYSHGKKSMKTERNTNSISHLYNKFVEINEKHEMSLFPITTRHWTEILFGEKFNQRFLWFSIFLMLFYCLESAKNHEKYLWCFRKSIMCKWIAFYRRWWMRTQSSNDFSVIDLEIELQWQEKKTFELWFLDFRGLVVWMVLHGFKIDLEAH